MRANGKGRAIYIHVREVKVTDVQVIRVTTSRQ